MAIFEHTYGKLPSFLMELEHAAGTTLEELVSSGNSTPLIDIADIIASRNDGLGYVFGRHQDNAAAVIDDDTRIAVKLKSSNGIIVDRNAPDTVASKGHHIGELSAVDMIMAANCLKSTLAGPYLLVRYDLIACYANPYMDTMDSIWDAYDALMCECRSTVVDIRHLGDGQAITSMPYYKFRNLGETASYDIEHVRRAIEEAEGRMIATEKLDGSMVQLRYIEDEDREGGVFDGGMLYSTSGTIVNSTQAEGNSHIEALEGYLHSDGCYFQAAREHAELTFIYEMVDSEADRHVVLYPAERWGLYLTGARRVSDGSLLDRSELEELSAPYGIALPKVVATNIDEALEYQAHGDGSIAEGMVADISGWLVKIKLASFLELSAIYHELEGSAGFKAIGRLVADDAVDDACASMPKGLKDYVVEVAKRFVAFDEKQRETISALSEKMIRESDGTRRGYALNVNAADIPARWKGWLFQQVSGKPASHFWFDEKGASRRFLAQSEFEERERVLETWLEEHSGELI